MASRPRPRRAAPRATSSIALVCLAMLAGAASGACSSGDGAPTAGSVGDGTGTTLGASAGPGAPGTTVPLPSNDAIEAALDAEHPAEHALVDWSLFTRQPMAGYRVPVAEGTDRTQAVAVCDAVVTVLAATGARADVEVLAGSTVLASATVAAPTCAAR